jgi:hypothetical protein
LEKADISHSNTAVILSETSEKTRESIHAKVKGKNEKNFHDLPCQTTSYMIRWEYY